MKGTATRLTGDQPKAPARNRQPLLAIPYYAWSHRGPNEMAVWIWRDSEKALAASAQP